MISLVTYEVFSYHFLFDPQLQIFTSAIAKVIPGFELLLIWGINAAALRRILPLTFARGSKRRSQLQVCDNGLTVRFLTPAAL
jgi:hypothetical protein